MQMPTDFTLAELRNAPDLDALTHRVGTKGLTPGWLPRDKPILRFQPSSNYQLQHWKWADAKAGMDGAAKLIGTDLAERRNLVMRNMIEGNDFASLRTLVSAYQTILPGENARSHRHAPHAFRVILDSHGAWSCVNGEKHPMETGDVVLTPGWHWHGHGHDGQDQAYWFDGLDVPLVDLLEPMFFEEHPQGMEPIVRVTPDSPYRFSWDWQMRMLDQIPDDPDGVFGRRIAIDTTTMPTMAIHVQRWNAGFRSRPYRCTANQIWLVTKGSGSTTIDNRTIEWGFGDTFAIPTWKKVVHHAREDAVLMSQSDEPLQRFCKYWRAETLD